MALDFSNLPPMDSLYGKSNLGTPTKSSGMFSDKDGKLDFNAIDPYDSTSSIEEELGEDYSVTNLAQHSGFVSMVDGYLDQRYGSSRKRGETNEEVVEEYLTHYRYMYNNSIDTAQENDFLRQTDKKTKDTHVILDNIYQDTPNFLTEGGGNVMSGIRDSVFSQLTDPTIVVGLGAGAGVGGVLAAAAKQVGKKATTRMILKAALKNNLGKISGMTSVEGLLGSMHESQLQEIRVQTGQMEEKDVGDIVTAGVLTGGLSLAGVPLAARGIAKAAAKVGQYTPPTRMQRITAMRNEGEETFVGPSTLQQSRESSMLNAPTEAYKFDPETAKALRNRIAPGTDLLDSKITVEVSALAGKAAMAMHRGMMESLNPDIRKKFSRLEGEKNSDLIARILTKVGEVDDEVVERAITQQGLTVSDFAQLQRLTASEAGKTLQAFRGMETKFKKMAGEDPELAKKLKELYAKPDDASGAVATIYDILRRADRETRAMMVSQLSTTARNVLSGAAYLSFGSAAKLLEGTIYGVGKSLQSIGGGTASVQGTMKGTTKIVHDATSTIMSVLSHRDSSELAQEMLKHTPKLRGTLFRSLQETGNESLSQFTRSMNGLNMAQDVVLRSGVFTDSVNVRMAKVGLSMEEYIGKNKDIPMEILKASIEDSLEATFARTPKSIVLKKFVELVERLPFAPVMGTFTFPFARFTADALAFQASYSPANFFSAAGAGYRAARSAITAKKMTDPEAKAMWLRAAKTQTEDAVTRVSQGAVGSAALYGAYQYRKEHPELKWYEVMHEGKPVDIRAIFPAAPYLAVADIMANLGDNAPDEVFGQIMEGMTGSQLRGANIPGAVGDFFEAVQNLDGSDVSAEKLGEMFGNWTGSITGRILTPAAVIRDAFAVFDSTEAIQRSSRITEGEGMGEKFVSAFTNNLKTKMPILQKDLPEYQSPTKEGTVYRQSPFSVQVTGVKSLEQRSQVETELATQGIEPYELFAGTGNRQADYLVDKHAPVYVNAILGAVIQTPFYQGLPKYQKVKVIKKRLQEARKMIKGLAEGEATMQAFNEGKTYSVFDKAGWGKLPATQRRMADEYFQRYYGSSVAELGAYKAGIQIGRALERAL